VLTAFLISGGVAAWYVLLRVTQNHSGMANDGTHAYYWMWGNILGALLGAAAGSWFTLTAPQKQFVHALAFSVVVSLIVLAVAISAHWVMYSVERYDAFFDWTHNHHVTWLGNAVFWLDYWDWACWLLPQLVAQLVAVPATLLLKRRVLRRRERAATG
jgi:hypothetical protein